MRCQQKPGRSHSTTTDIHITAAHLKRPGRVVGSPAIEHRVLPSCHKPVALRHENQTALYKQTRPLLSSSLIKEIRTRTVKKLTVRPCSRRQPHNKLNPTHTPARVRAASTCTKITNCLCGPGPLQHIVHMGKTATQVTCAIWENSLLSQCVIHRWQVLPRSRTTIGIQDLPYAQT